MRGSQPLVRQARRRELRDALLTRVVLSGGTATMPGFSERLKFELERTLEPAPDGVNPQVVVWKPVVGMDRDQTIWSGASILAGTTGFVDSRGVYASMG